MIKKITLSLFLILIFGSNLVFAESNGSWTWSIWINKTKQLIIQWKNYEIEKNKYIEYYKNKFGTILNNYSAKQLKLVVIKVKNKEDQLLENKTYTFLQKQNGIIQLEAIIQIINNYINSVNINYFNISDFFPN